MGCRVIAIVSKLLSDAGVEHALFKGWTAARHYAEPAHRPFGDTDILVAPEQRQRALDILAPLSRQPKPHGAQDNLTNEAMILELKYPENLSKVDLHFDVRRFCLSDAKTVLRRAEAVDICGRAVPLFCAEDLFKTLCLHMLGHGCWRALWLCDIAAALEKIDGDFDWQVCHLGDALAVNFNRLRLQIR